MKSKIRSRSLVPAIAIAGFVPFAAANALELKRGNSFDVEGREQPQAAAIQPAPASVSAKGLNGGVQLNWTPAAGATGYNVYLGTAAGSEAQSPVLSNIGGTGATVSGLQNDTEYFLKVTASGGAGESAASVEVRAVPYLPIADAPIFSIGTGTYTSIQHVRISDAVANASIYYTLDGSLPTTSSARYSGTLTIDASTTLTAIAVASGHSDSGLTTAVYTLNLPPAVEVPVFSVLGGTYSSTQYVQITDGTQGASIFYTTDGSDPTTASTPYSGTIEVKSTTTLKAIATAKDLSDSPIASVTYTIKPPASSGGGAFGLVTLGGLGILGLARRRKTVRKPR